MAFLLPFHLYGAGFTVKQLEISRLITLHFRGHQAAGLPRADKHSRLLNRAELLLCRRWTFCGFFPDRLTGPSADVSFSILADGRLLPAHPPRFPPFDVANRTSPPQEIHSLLHLPYALSPPYS